MATYQLRAMSFGEILDGAFTIFGRQFPVLMGILLVSEGLPFALMMYSVLAIGGVAFEPMYLGLFSLSLLLFMIGGLWAAGAIVHVVSEGYLGRSPTVGEALGFALGKMWGLLVSGLVKYLLIIFASIFLIVPGIIVACGYAVVAQVVVLEGGSAIDALGRSWSLTKGFKGKALGLGFVIYVLASLPGAAMGVLAIFVPSLAMPLDLVGRVVGFMLYPLIACAFTLFYYDLRVRKEAFDLVHLSEQLGFGSEPAGA